MDDNSNKEVPSVVDTTTTTRESLMKCDVKELSKLVSKDVDITKVLSENTVDNMKAWLIVYSRSQLTRVVRLTDALNKLEDNILTRASCEDVDLDQLCKLVTIIQKSLNSSLDLIKQVTTDESYLKVIINSTSVVNNNLAQYNNISNASDTILKSKNSRDKVRSAITAILSKVDELETTTGVASDLNEVIIDEKSSEDNK
jgi:hypothetical protein